MARLYLYALELAELETIDLASAVPFAHIDAPTVDEAKAQLSGWWFYIGDRVLATQEVPG